MHDFVLQDRAVLQDLADWIVRRRDGLPQPRRRSAALPPLNRDGVGIEATWALLRDEVLPSAFATDHPRYLAFVGGAPTPAAIIADAALSAAAVYGGSELEAGQVVAVERAAMRWLCDMVGYPAEAHGAFVSGGSTANLSALVAARHGRVASDGSVPRIIVAGMSAHASVNAAAAIMGCEVLLVGSADQPLDAADLDPVLDRLDPRDVVAVVATAGATNTGIIDRMDEVSRSCAEHGIWLHVDAAYGGAALLSPAQRTRFLGIEQADSVTIDPHKWLFTPYDCAAVLYRDPAWARSAHRQRASYLDVVDEGDNPADYATHLSRRARGLPLWASLHANGTDGYVDAVEQCLALTDHAVKAIEASTHLELVLEPHLSVVLFRRKGWDHAQYDAWSRAAREDGSALVTPTQLRGNTVFRFCFVNPLTTTDDIDDVIERLVAPAGGGQ